MDWRPRPVPGAEALLTTLHYSLSHAAARLIIGEDRSAQKARGPGNGSPGLPKSASRYFFLLTKVQVTVLPASTAMFPGSSPLSQVADVSTQPAVGVSVTK